MASADGMVIGAGAIAFAGSFKEASGFPSNGYSIVGATAALAVIFSLARNSPLEPAVKALAALSLLAAIYRYVPAFTPTKKGKSNG